ncbi:MAG: hypothetical protein H0T51_25630 [Pirellulales bacterium]|nr:hypothetical protein [Pirellulales bacterium]
MSTQYDIGELVTQHRLLKAQQLTTEVGDRINPDVLPQGEPLPALRYETNHTDNQHDLSGQSGEAFTRLQIDSYGRTRREANHVAAIVEDLLDGWGGEAIGPDDQVWVFECTLDNQWDQRDQPAPGSDEYRYIRKQDFVIGHTKPTPSLTPLT